VAGPARTFGRGFRAGAGLKNPDCYAQERIGGSGHHARRTWEVKLSGNEAKQQK